MNLFKRCLLSPYCVLGTESCRQKAQARLFEATTEQEAGTPVFNQG